MAKTYNPGKWERGVQGGPTILSNPASSSLNQYFGKTLISSNTGNRHAINAGVVTSESVIFTQLQHVSSGADAMPPLVVTSIYPGSGFILTTAASWALANSYYVVWEVKNRR